MRPDTEVGTDSVNRVAIPTRSTESPYRSYERTNGRTNKRLAHVTHKSSLTDTCARVQDFDYFSGRINTSRSEQDAWDA